MNLSAPVDEWVHASCVTIPHTSHAVLLTGQSGSGKSDLALRLIHMGGELVSDDQVGIYSENGYLYACPPQTLAGKLEVREVGIIEIPYRSTARIVMVVELVSAQEVERLPERHQKQLQGCELPLYRLHAFHASAPYKIIAASRGLA